MKKLLQCCAAAVLVLAAPALAIAQGAYPTKPIRLIVAFPPGGSTDIVARLVGQKLSERLGQQVIIDNRGGAGGMLGTDLAAKSPADGYTLTMGTTSTHVIAPAAYPTVKYDPVKDFVPTTLVASTPYLLVLNPSVPAKTLKDFVALMKSQPGKLNYASAGAGSTTHLAMEMLKLASGTDIVHVPYNGNGPAGTAVLGGQVQALFGSMPAVLPQAKAGKMRPIAVGTAQALAGAARRADRGGAGLPGLRGLAVARLLRAEGHARADREAAHHRADRHRQLAGDEGAVRAQRGEPADHDAGRADQADEVRARQVLQGHQAGQHQALSRSAAVSCQPPVP